nr:probable cyclic nucleotide-gated ion channel 5 [Tanacetum cinerariifolium]
MQSCGAFKTSHIGRSTATAMVGPAEFRPDSLCAIDRQHAGLSQINFYTCNNVLDVSYANILSSAMTSSSFRSLLNYELHERVRRYFHYKWLGTRVVDEESLVQSLPKKEMPTTKATAQGIASIMRLNGEYAPYGNMLKVPEIMGRCLKLLSLKLCKVAAPLKPPISGEVLLLLWWVL